MVLGARGLGVAFGAAAGSMWGLVFLAPELTRDFTPLQLSAGRYLAYGIAACVLLAPRWRALAPRIRPEAWRGLAWLSLAGNSLYFVLLASAVQLAGVAPASLVVGVLPVTVALAGRRDKGAAPLARLAPSLLLVIAGTACIGWRALAAPHASAPAPVAGLLCAAGALAAWTAYAVGNSRWLGRLDQVSAHDWNLLLGVVTGAQALVLAVPAFLVPIFLSHAAPHPPAAWLRFAAVCAGVALLASLFGNAMWNRMSRLLPLTLAGPMILFETLFALLYGFIWEHRVPSVLELAAIALVCAGVVACVSAHAPEVEPLALET